MAWQPSTISPEQQLQYQQGRSNARQDNLRNQAQNRYEAGLAQNDYANELYNFNVDQNRRREGISTPFIQGGIFHSGIYRDALKKYAIDRLAGQNQLSRNFQNRMAGLTFQGRNSADQYAQTIANLFGNQYAAQASIASALKGIL